MLFPPDWPQSSGGSVWARLRKYGPMLDETVLKVTHDMNDD